MIDSTEINDELQDRWDDVKNGPVEDYETSLKDVKDLTALLKEAREMESEKDLKAKELELEKYKAETERMKIKSDERIATWQNVIRIGGTITVVGISAMVLFREDTGTVTSKVWNVMSTNIARMIPTV